MLAMGPSGIYTMLWTVALLGIFQGAAGAVMYEKAESFKLSKGSVLGSIDVVNEMHFEMDIAVHSLPTGWASILHATPSGDNCCDIGDRMPGIWLHPNSATEGALIAFDNNDQGNAHFWIGHAMVAGGVYHLEIDVTQSSMTVHVDGETVYNAAKPTHPTFQDATLYAADPWYDAADATISNLLVTDGTATTTAEPTKQPTATPTSSPTMEPTKDCSALHIDEFLVDCSTEFDGHGDRIENLENGGSSMMDTLTGHSQDIATLMAAASTLENATATMSAAINAHGARIDSVESEESSMATELTQHAQDISTLEATVSGLVNATATLTVSANSLNADLQHIMEHLDILGDYQTDSGMTPIAPMPLGTSDYALYALAATNLIVVMCLAIYCVFVRTAPKYGKVAMYETEA